jgi:hypothetical protein
MLMECKSCKGTGEYAGLFRKDICLDCGGVGKVDGLDPVLDPASKPWNWVRAVFGDNAKYVHADNSGNLHGIIPNVFSPYDTVVGTSFWLGELGDLSAEYPPAGCRLIRMGYCGPIATDFTVDISDWGVVTKDDENSDLSICDDFTR